MNVHLREPESASTLSMADDYVLGMPHLCPSGLSENWLWKELGHRHWRLIARALGRSSAGFGPANERPVYAAFRRVSLQEGNLGIAGENDVLEIHSAITHLSETRVASRHLASSGNQTVADVEMTSVFVQRQVDGCNRSIARVRIERPHRITAPLGRPFAGREDAGYRPADGALQETWIELGTTIVEPCPYLEFNGAGLLYFSSFIAAVDRAEWHVFGGDSGLSSTRSRSAIFHSNIEIGDSLRVELAGPRKGSPCDHRARLWSLVNGRLLAEIMTSRGRSQATGGTERILASAP